MVGFAESIALFKQKLKPYRYFKNITFSLILPDFQKHQLSKQKKLD